MSPCGFSKILTCGCFAIINIKLRKLRKKKSLDIKMDADKNDSDHIIQKINNVAFIIPSAPHHFHYVYSFIEPIYKNIDIHIVFSNMEDYDAFKEKDKIKPIIMKEPYQENFVSGPHISPIVTLKKFYGLKYLINSCYNYFIVCDAESEVVLENFTSSIVNNKINDIFNNKIIYGEKTDNNFLLNIMNISNNLFSTDQQEILQKETDNYSLYIWWSNLPVYKKEHLTDFFDIINYGNICWHHFDYIIYEYYLILYHNFKIVNANTRIVSLDLPTTTTEDEINQLNSLGAFKFGFSFIHGHLYKKYISYFKEKGTFLVGNLDR
jgi:hypothetical protein